MKLSWRKRIVAAAVLWVCTSSVMTIARMGPNELLVGGVVVAVMTVVWLAVDIADDARAAAWHPWPAATLLASTSDSRVDTIRIRLYNSGGQNPSAVLIHATLVELVDDQLLSVHGIDRASEPAAARDVMGDELTRLVSDPSAAKGLTDGRALTRFITLIENL